MCRTINVYISAMGGMTEVSIVREEPCYRLFYHGIELAVLHKYKEDVWIKVGGEEFIQEIEDIGRAIDSLL